MAAAKAKQGVDLAIELQEGNNHLTFTRCRRPNWRPFEIYSRELGEGIYLTVEES
jgi:hypothetical protein